MSARLAVRWENKFVSAVTESCSRWHRETEVTATAVVRRTRTYSNIIVNTAQQIYDMSRMYVMLSEAYNLPYTYMDILTSQGGPDIARKFRSAFSFETTNFYTLDNE